jgi:aryl-alcohol dehydrogenase-like predicted oxidoreductase
MQQRNIGRSDLRVSVVGLGCNNFGGRIDFNASRRVVHKALDVGITLFDTADIYGERGGSEKFLGEILGPRRRDIVLASKFGMPMDDEGRLRGASRGYVMSAIEATLKRLRTDWIDLYQLHRPDPKTPIEETLRALDDLVRQGKVRYAGCSNLPAWQVVEAQWTARHHGLNAFVSSQNEYSLLVRDTERELLPALESYGLGLLPYYPLAGGLLTGKYKRHLPPPQGARLSNARYGDRYLNETNWTRVARLEEFCTLRRRRLLELAFSWLLSRPCLASVIAGATRPEQVEANVRAADWTLSPDDLAEIDRVTAQA